MKHKWHNKLYNVEQGKDEQVPEYVIKFKHLKKKVDPGNRLPDDYVVHLFLSGLRQKIAMYTTIKDSQTLEEAIEIAEQVEAGKYYGKSKPERGWLKKRD